MGVSQVERGGEGKVRPIHGPGHHRASGLGKELGKEKMVIVIMCTYWDGGRMVCKGAFTNSMSSETNN